MHNYEVRISPRAAQLLREHAMFLSNANQNSANKFIEEFQNVSASLSSMPYQAPILHSDEFQNEKYRKLLFFKHYLLIYQIKDNTVYIEYVLDCKQDYEWLLK